ncbi:MAG: InlB B-repeat-containing protein [Clostridia bacterium]|nr:InlB B-repeat-containing protein [Clostridia bacterium]
METRAKLPKKILSLFLSLLMAVSCFSIALPELVSMADASTQAQWTALQNAFDEAAADGILSGSDASVSTSGTTNTISDTSAKGHLYKIADLLYAIVKTDYGAGSHHERMRPEIKGKLTLNSYQKNYIDSLLPVTGNYGYSSDSDCSYTQYVQGGYPANPLSGNITHNVVVTRTVKAAITSDCATAAVVPTAINTQINYSVTAVPKSANGGTSSTTVKVNNGQSGSKYSEWDETRTTYRTKGWYENSSLSTSYGTSATPNLSAITSYLNYVNAASFQEGYAEWEANPTSIYLWELDTLNAIEPAYKPYSEALAAIDEYYVNLYIGSTQKGKYDQYANACTGAVEAAKYIPVIEWIRDGASLEGYLDRDSYEAWTEVRVPENRANLEALLEDTLVLQAIIDGCSEGTKTAFQNVYGYRPAMFTQQIETLTDLIEIYDLTDLYDEIIFRMTHDETEVYNGDPALWGAINYESYKYTSVGQVCPVETEMLTAAAAYFNAKVNNIGDTDTFKEENVIKVFADNGTVTFDDVKAFRDELIREINYRNHEVSFKDYYSYFEGIRYERYQLVSFNSIKNIISQAEAKYTELKNYYNQAVEQLGATKAAQIYGNYPETVRSFIDSLYKILYDRSYQQHYNLLDSAFDIDNGVYDGTLANEVTNANFSAVKRNVANIDMALYEWVQANCKNKGFDLETLADWNGFRDDYLAAVEAVIALAWNAFKQVQLDTPGGSGYYTTRYARVNDMVREDYLDEDDYVVTEDKILTVIGKLDSFITSEAFTKLLGVYRETEEPELDENGSPTGEMLPAIHTLSEYIENLLLDMLFNDEMINTIISMLFPMLTDLIGGLLLNLFDKENTMLDSTWLATPESGADGALNIKAIIDSIGGVDGLDVRGGVIHAYFNGKQGTPRLAKAFSDLGIKIYPTYLADALASTANGRAGKYNAIISALRNANENWMYFDNTAVGGNGDGEITAEDLQNYTWGVNDYTTFCAVIGDVFTSILPVLQVLFTNYTYTTPKINNLLYVHGRNLDVNYTVDIKIGHAYGYGHLQLTLNGVEGYKNIWGTLFETLGISKTVANNNPTVQNPLSTTFGNSGNSASAAQFANCMFVPLLSLVETLAAKPIDTVMGIIPNLMQSVAYGFVQPLLDAVSTNINLKASIEITDTDDVEAIVSWGLDLSWIVNGFLGVINDALVDIINVDIPLELGGMLDLEELLGVEDLSDINGIIDHFLLTAEEDSGSADGDTPQIDLTQISIPTINAGQWASLGQKVQTSSIRTKNFNNTLGAGQRYTIVADKADMLYAIIQWLLDFISVEGNLAGLMSTLADAEIPIEVDKILAGIDADDALAALVELFLPQDYSMEDYDWYQSNEEGSRYNLTASDFVYLKYANNWTREKAEYLYNNVDAMANTIVNMIDPELLKDFGGNVNLYLQDMINSMFNNEGIMNVIDLVVGIGDGLKDQEMIVNLIKDQISSGGADAGVDLLTWYKSFGYLTYDYSDKYDEETGELIVDEFKPLKPGEAGYVNEFPALAVDVKETVNEEGETVKEYFWYLNGEALVDGADNAREIFTGIFCELLKPIAPIVGLLFTRTDLGLFNNAIVINGADCYSGAIIPVYEMLGIYDMKTQAEYTADYKNDSAAGFEYLVNKLFDRVTEILTIDTVMVDGAMVEYGPVQKVVDLLPSLFYFIQSDGISTLLKNLLHPIWNLVDTIRPIADVDLDAFIHQFATSYLGLVYDKTDTVNYPSAPLVDLLMGLLDLGFETPEYSDAQAAEDKDLVDGIYKLSIENLDLEAIYFVVETMFGIDLSPLSYALEGMCVPYTRDGETYGVRAYQSKSGKTAYTLDYNGPDTLTVTFSAILDLLMYGDNAAALDKMLGFVKEVAPDEEGNLDNISAAGILEALTVIFEDKADSMGEQPNWDYLLEGKMVFGKADDGITDIAKEWVDGDYQALQTYSDLSMYHSINNLNYYTDWTEDTARATDEVLKNVLDYVVTMIDPEAVSFGAFIEELLATELFHADTLKALVDLLAQLFDLIPAELLAIVDTLLETNVQAWATYVEMKEVLDEEGNGTGEYKWSAKASHKWWADPEAADYVDTKDEFLAAVTELLTPISKLLGVIFLGTDYRLFYTISNGPGTVGYGDDAIVINGLNAYAKGIIPIFEALGLDLTNYKPEKYELGINADGDMLYNEELFVHDFVEILSNFIDLLAADPVNWLIDTLPGLIYFINADGLSTSLMNIVDSLIDVLDIINGLLEEDQKIDLTNIEGIDLTHLNLSAIFGLLEDTLGIHIRGDLNTYIGDLYVGQLTAYTSANGQTAFTMDYSTVEERHDMITILLALLVEIIADEGTYTDENGALVEYNNAAAIDALINGDNEEAVDYVSGILGALKNPESVIYKDINWNYFDETIDLTDTDEDGRILVPGYAFQYLNYTTDWTYDSAAKTAEGFEDLILGILNMTGLVESGATLSDTLKELLDLDSIFTGDTLQSILDLVSPLLFGEDAVLNQSLIELIGAVLGADLTDWNYEYSFENKVEGEDYTLDTTTGLYYRVAERQVLVVDAEGNAVLDADGNEQYEGNGQLINVYGIETREDFINGFVYLFQPAYRLLSWLLFGEGYEFFNGNTEATAEDVLITIQGSDGYKEGLALLLEALGCTGLGVEAKYKTVDADGNTTVDMRLFLTDLANSLFTRIDEILANPVDEIVNLIPELLYFINAGGLQVSVGNLVAGPLNLVNKFAEITGDSSLSVDGLLQDVLRDATGNEELTFTLDGINLQYVFELVEMFTGLEITDVVGNKLAYFYMGEIIPYNSGSGKLAYRMRFSNDEDFADFITILLSFVIDVALWDGNAAALETLIGLEPGLVQAIVKAIKESYTIEVVDIDWFYFDETIDTENFEVIPGETTVNLPGRTINYLSYASDWNKQTADFVFQNRNDIIAAVLSMTGNGDTTLADIIAQSFSLNEDLYTAENLNAIIELVTGLTGNLDKAITDLLDIVISVDLGVYNTMEKFTDDQITDRVSFVNGLYKVLYPVFPVLDWLLFADDLQFFNRDNDTSNVDPEGDDIQVLINLPGAEGYKYAFVPLFEALGVKLPDIKATDKTEDVFYTLVNNVLARAEAILANPVDEVLALLPNLLYFINANGLSAVVNNLAGGILQLLDTVNEVLPEEDKISVEKFLAEALGVDESKITLNNLDLLYLIGIAEEATGLAIREVITDAKIDKFYLGKMEYYTSANGKPAFRMVYSDTEGGAEMLTVIINLLLEVVLYKNEETGVDNVAALEELLELEEGTVNDIIEIIPTLGAEPNYIDFDWNYMGGTVDPVTYDITLPKTAFLNYFTYKSDITQETANYFYDNLGDLITGILRMTGAEEDADTLEEIVAGSFNLYQAEYLNAIVDLTAKLYELLDARLIEVAGMLLGIDVSLWEGLEYTDAEIYDRETFAAGLTEVITPVFRVLDWLLFGDSYEFFVKNEDGTTTLLKVAGNEGYKYGLAPILEAIGVDLPTLLPAPSCATMFRPVIDAVLERYDEVMGNIIPEALELLPNLLYFINANGLATAVNNLAGSVLNVIDVLNENGIADIDLKELLYGVDITNLDLEAVFTLLEDLEVLGAFEFNNAFRGYTTENADGTITFVRDVTGENIIQKFYIGDIDPYISSTGELAYKMQLTEESRGDIVVLLLSFAIDAVLYGDNAKALGDKFGFDGNMITSIAALLAQKIEYTPAGINWVYFLGLEGEELDAAIENVLAGKFNELPELPERTLHYIEYDNNWNEETAEYLVDNLPEIIDLVIAMATDYATLNDFINANLDIYSNDMANMMIHGVADLLKDLDEYVLNHAGVLLGVDIDTLMNYTATTVTDKASFVDALATAFGGVGEILDLVLFGEDYTLFTKLENGEEAMLTISGGDGYVNGLAPILSMLGVDTNIGEIPEVDGELSITEQVLETVLLRVCDRIDEILANPVDEVFDILLNLFYFVNADGLTASVNNLLLPVNYIMEGVGDAIGKDLSLSELIGFDLSDLSFEGISAILKEETGIDLWGAVGDYLGTFYFGELEYYEYAQGKGAFRMVYTDEEEAHDFITIVLSVVLDTFVYPGNKDALVSLFGENGEGIYNVIMAFLTDSEVEVPMKPYQWLFTEKANTGEVLSPVTGEGLYDYMYGELYTREMGEYITKWLPSFIDTMIVLLGVKDENGDLYTGLQDIFDQLIGTSIYKTDLLQTIVDALKGLIGDLKESIGEELFTHIANVLNYSLGVNVAYWDNYTVTPIAEGDKEAFINELLDILTPVYPLLAFLLTDEDLAFFNKDDGIEGSVVSDENSYVIIHGAEGYAYGIIPILEAFGYDNDKIMTPEAYKTAAAGDPEALLRGILDPILGRVDEILADPIDELLATLPGIIYFLNSKGLDTAFNNAINAVLRVLETIEPITGEIDLYEVIGFNFEVDIEGLIDQLLTSVAEDTGFELTEVAMEAITELTLGEVISYTSKNGDEAYTMVYATGADSVDFVTIILRLVLTFISIPENVVALEAILKDNLTGDGYTFLCSLLENFSQMAADKDGMDEIMYTVYQIFYAANVAAHKTNDWYQNFNGDYSFLNQLFATSDLAFLRQIEISLGGLLNKYTGDIIDDDQLAPNGFIAFFQKIADFFKKIADFFKNLFS